MLLLLHAHIFLYSYVVFAINKLTVQQYADSVHVCLSGGLLILQLERK